MGLDEPRKGQAVGLVEALEGGPGAVAGVGGAGQGDGLAGAIQAHDPLEADIEVIGERPSEITV